MEPPTSFHPEAIRDEKLKLLRAIRPFTGEQDIARRAVRGQYARGGTREHPLPGYREEPGVEPVSSVETFVALRLDIDNWRWAGVPVYIRTGKRLPARITEVALEFQRPPQLPLFPNSDPEPDALLLRVAPNEGLTIRFAAKVPGRSFDVRKASMDFEYREGFPSSSDAYERVIFDALVGDPTLFIRADEVGRSWRIVDPIIGHWAHSAEPIPLYQAGTWGPREATNLVAADGRRWRHSSDRPRR
jgi:glucose-6-phosphate 1-dehydrogenase